MQNLLIRTIVCFAVCLFISSPDIRAQEVEADSTITNYSAHKRALSFSGLLQTRFLGSLTKHVDVNGVHYDPALTKGVTNSFLIKRARLQVKATINDHFSANFMINFAEFNTNPTGKVLENAFVKYTLNRHFNVQVGQFRPYFGIEDAVPVDLIRTIDYSNQYYAFGRNGWQSFQIGLTVYGAVTPEDAMPVRYYVGVYNGNNKNQTTDNNDSKNVYGRLEAEVYKGITIGANAGVGSLTNETGSAYGGDLIGNFSLSQKLKLILRTEYKEGTNFSQFNSSTIVPKPNISEFKMQGFYLFPILRYEYKRPRMRAIEFSTRYERLNENHKLSDNLRQTFIPNLTLIFADDFYVALQGGVMIDRYKNKIPLSSTYSSNIAYLQLQIRF